MSVTRLTALTIQGHPDTESMADDGIYVCAAEAQPNRWFGEVHLVKGGYPHALLLSTKPVFDTKDKATGALKDTIAQVRALDLS